MNLFFSAFALPPVADGSLTYAFLHSDLMGQGIVIGLTLLSIVTWTLMLEKGIGLKRAYKGSRSFLEEFRRKKNVISLRTRAEDDPSPAARVYESGFARLAQFNGDETGMNITHSRPLTPVEIDVVRSTMEETVADQIVKLEDKVIVLMTAVSISPFMGLFGTVWGIMLAFTEMAMAGKPDIQTLAPGVSGALLTTVLGLLVAIPSLIGYNWITFYIKQVTVYMDNQVEEFTNKLKLVAVEAEARKQEEKEKETERVKPEVKPEPAPEEIPPESPVYRHAQPEVPPVQIVYQTSPPPQPAPRPAVIYAQPQPAPQPPPQPAPQPVYAQPEPQPVPVQSVYTPPAPQPEPQPAPQQVYVQPEPQAAPQPVPPPQAYVPPPRRPYTPPVQNGYAPQYQRPPMPGYGDEED